MRAEKRRVNALLRAKQQNLKAIHDRVRTEDVAQREFLTHQRDIIAVQTKADRLFKEHQTWTTNFQPKE